MVVDVCREEYFVERLSSSIYFKNKTGIVLMVFKGGGREAKRNEQRCLKEESH